MSNFSVAILIIAGPALVIAVASAIGCHRSFRPYLRRPCSGRLWRGRFPTATKAEIRSFLALFVTSFGVPPAHGLRFTPDDRVMDIYYALNPRTWTLVDAMELETFAADLGRVSGLDPMSYWFEGITLGEIFGRTLARRDGADAVP